MMIRYKVYQDFTLSQEHLDSLTQLYQAVFSYPALGLYLTLHSLSRQNNYVNQREILKLLHINEETLDAYRKELEQFGLIQTYEEEVLEMVLNPCLTPSQFLAHTLYSRLFVIVEGHHRFAYYCDLYRVAKPQNLSREITQTFDVSRISSWDLTSEDQYNSAMEKELSQYQFDAVTFFKNWPLFNQDLVTPDVLKLVAEYGSSHKVSISDMKQLLLEVEKESPEVFDTRVFATKIAQKHGAQSAESVDNIYDLEPVSFLRHLQQFDVSHVDKSIIERIKSRYDFENSVINLLIETMLKNGNSINYSYAISIADPWVRQGVGTYDEAKAALAAFDKRVSGQGKTSPKSKRISSQAIQPVYSEMDEQASDAELAEFKAGLGALGKGDS